MCVWNVKDEDRMCEFCTLKGSCDSVSFADNVDYKAKRSLQIMNDVIGCDVRAKSRKNNLVWARNLLAYKLSEYGLSLSQIGKVIDRDHSTSFHGMKKAENAMKYPSMYQDVMNIWSQFSERLSLEKL